MVHPLAVYVVEHAISLESRKVYTYLVFDVIALLLVLLFCNFHNPFDKSAYGVILEIDYEVGSKKLCTVLEYALLELHIEVVVIPVSVVLFVVNVLVTDIGNNRFHHSKYLYVYVHTVKHDITLFVDNLSLLVHYVVVSEYVFSYREVSVLHSRLRRLYLTGNKLAYDRGILVHRDCLSYFEHVVAAENSQHIVFHGEIEYRRTGVALTSATASELIVYTARFVAFRSYNSQSAGRYYFLLFCVRILCEKRVIFLVISSCFQYILVIGIGV